MSANEFTEQVTYRESGRILEIMDHVANNNGWQRADLIRKAIRQFLGAGAHLGEQEEKDLGL